ncbi:MAG: stage 0 sporulation family protein [Symbiobacteriaceae bacterium]|nr:stage 0 sporulation family protein [Symbiobacteriaceae bacterium]
MSEVIGVRFRPAGKVYFFLPGELPIEQYDHVLVETVRGMEIGKVAYGRREVCPNIIAPYLPLKQVLRVATAADLALRETLQTKAQDAYQICLGKIEQHRLGMRLLDAEYTFDAAKLIFQFTADGRVDFRELVRDLASVFRTRIELRQVGVRDEAKMVGGLGGCGREFCCSTFLGEFLPVTVKMARDQNLSLNPTKISGVCGRLLCCLNYELEEYGSSASLSLVEMGSLVQTNAGHGKVTFVDRRRDIARVRLQDSGRTQEFPLDELVVIVLEEDDGVMPAHIPSLILPAKEEEDD